MPEKNRQAGAEQEIRLLRTSPVRSTCRFLNSVDLPLLNAAPKQAIKWDVNT